MIYNNFRGGKIIKKRLSSIVVSFVLVLLFISTGAHSSPPEIFRYFNRADWHLVLHQYDKAIENYLKGIIYAEKKDIPKVWDDLGYAYIQRREIGDAIKYLKKASSVRPENFNVYLYLAIACLLNNELDLASKELKKIENNIYFDQRWLKIISNSELRRTDGKSISIDAAERLVHEKGIHVYIKDQGKTRAPSVSIQIDAFNEKNEGLLYFTQGILHKKSKEYENAEKKLLDALDAGYDEKEVRFQLRDLYIKTDQSVKAEKQTDALKKLDFLSWSTHEAAFHIHHRLKGHVNNLLYPYHERSLKELEKGNIEESIRILEEAFLISEDSFVINHNLALLYFDIHKLEKAEMYCGRALWFKEKDPGSHDLMGNIYFHQKENEKALKEFKRMLEIDESNAHAHYNLGSIYYVLNDWPNAEHHWKKAIEYEKNKLKIRKENYPTEKGLAHSLIVRKRPISFLSHKSLGNLFFEQGFTEKSIVEFEWAIKLKPNEADPYLNLAKAYHKKGEKNKTVLSLEKYLYLGGKEEEEARELLNVLKKKK